MPTYITLVNYTQHGIEHIDESPERLEEAKAVTSEHGGEFRDFFLTLGEYDAVYMADFPTDGDAAKALLTIARGGAVETETLKAFTEDEYRDIVAGLE